jgi:hypothetical protein
MEPDGDRCHVVYFDRPLDETVPSLDDALAQDVARGVVL